jgi:hypothetical protein
MAEVQRGELLPNDDGGQGDDGHTHDDGNAHGDIAAASAVVGEAKLYRRRRWTPCWIAATLLRSTMTATATATLLHRNRSSGN